MEIKAPLSKKWIKVYFLTKIHNQNYNMELVYHKKCQIFGH
jgi:hypothetical protein